ncbi:MAG: threonylcarbamoyl-AMP synthase [Deltaproteobacteria bacterium]|mgnify:CR=1 FL=1|nr:MAG: threonylcarbamoyl-AMP synthase [Deltaproteobacteria bacterium]
MHKAKVANILRIDPQRPSFRLIEEVVEVLKEGGVVIYPTETLYGLGTNPFCLTAIKRLYEIKGRKEDKPIPFLIKDVGMLAAFVKEVPPLGRTLAKKYWPGPLTLIFWAKEGLPFPLKGKDGKIGLRVSSHPIARMILEGLDTPLTSTSANLAGRADLTDVQRIYQIFGEQVDLIIDGGEVAGVASTVIDLTETPPKILREGIIKKPLLEEK